MRTIMARYQTSTNETNPLQPVITTLSPVGTYAP
jgi:hypothetical protein